MINNSTYSELNRLSERVKFDITTIKCTILDWLSINFIENILTKPYPLTFEQEHKLIDLINKVKNHGSE